MVNFGYRRMYTVFDIARDPTRRVVWSSGATRPDMCECMLASGPMLYLMALGEGMDNSQFSVSRLLRASERAHLQVAPASVGMLCMTERVGKLVFCKAMALPVIGSVLAMERQA